MAALSADRDPKRSTNESAEIVCTTGTTIYGGSLVMTTTATGLSIPGADTASCHFAGIAKERVTVATAGQKSEVYTSGCFEVVMASAAQTNDGATVCISDDQTVALIGTTTNDVKCGKQVAYVDATHIRICIDGYAKGSANGIGDS